MVIIRMSSKHVLTALAETEYHIQTGSRQPQIHTKGQQNRVHRGEEPKDPRQQLRIKRSGTPARKKRAEIFLPETDRILN